MIAVRWSRLRSAGVLFVLSSALALDGCALFKPPHAAPAAPEAIVSRHYPLTVPFGQVVASSQPMLDEHHFSKKSVTDEKARFVHLASTSDREDEVRLTLKDAHDGRLGILVEATTKDELRRSNVDEVMKLIAERASGKTVESVPTAPPASVPPASSATATPTASASALPPAKDPFAPPAKPGAKPAVDPYAPVAKPPVDPFAPPAKSK